MSDESNLGNSSKAPRLGGSKNPWAEAVKQKSGSTNVGTHVEPPTQNANLYQTANSNTLSDPTDTEYDGGESSENKKRLLSRSQQQWVSNNILAIGLIAVAVLIVVVVGSSIWFTTNKNAPTVPETEVIDIDPSVQTTELQPIIEGENGNAEGALNAADPQFAPITITEGQPSLEGALPTEQILGNGQTAGNTNDGAQQPQPGAQPALPAGEEIINNNGLVVRRSITKATKVVGQPAMYVNINNLWALAGVDGAVFLPPGEDVSKAKFYDPRNPDNEITVQNSGALADVVHVGVSGAISSGYRASDDATVWFTSKDMTGDPVAFVIPRNTSGANEIYVAGESVNLLP